MNLLFTKSTMAKMYIFIYIWYTCVLITRTFLRNVFITIQFLNTEVKFDLELIKTKILVFNFSEYSFICFEITFKSVCFIRMQTKKKLVKDLSC